MFVGEGDIRKACASTGWQAAAALAVLLVAAPAWAGDFTAGTLDPARSLVAASHSTVVPVSPTVEQFNQKPARIEDAAAKDASIAAALSVNDVFGVAEGNAGEPPAGVEVALARAEDPARLHAAVSGPLAVANDLSLPTAREMMRPPEDVMPRDGPGGPIALNAAGE